MELLETIDDILEQEDHILPKGSTKVNTEFSFMKQTVLNVPI